MKVLVIFVCVVFNSCIFAAEEGDSCINKDKKNGVCVLLEQCTAARENIKRGEYPKICGFRQKEPIVCCINITSSVETTTEVKLDTTKNPTVIWNSTIPIGEISRAKCKEYAQYSYLNITSPLLTVKPQLEKIYECHVNAEILVIGSINSSINQYPYMAHIGFENTDNHTIVYQCGGNLISENFVLTAAHCFYSHYWGSPKLVRFGVTNVDDYEHRQEIKIAELYEYPKYKPPEKYHDIGLIKMEKPVEFNKFVRPACLNTIRNITYKTGVVTGWGLKKLFGAPSMNLLKSVLNISPIDKCNRTFPKAINLPNGIVEDLMICAEIISDQRKDVCQGDSGSGLQVRIQNSEELQCMSLIIGVTSFGRACGYIGVPGVYTRVSAYIDWIEQTVWPELL